jgi:hypothetical protein
MPLVRNRLETVSLYFSFADLRLVYLLRVDLVPSPCLSNLYYYLT